MSRKDIANQIGLTPAAVTMLCNDMMEAHMILEKGEMKEQKRAGRKKVLVDINYDFKYIVSVNIEAVDTSITVTNIRGNVLVEAKVHTRTDIEPQLFLEELAKEMKELQKEFGDDKTKAPQSGSMRDRVNQILNEDK
jgi:transcriptional regulator of PTS gene